MAECRRTDVDAGGQGSDGPARSRRRAGTRRHHSGWGGRPEPRPAGPVESPPIGLRRPFHGCQGPVGVIQPSKTPISTRTSLSCPAAGSDQKIPRFSFSNVYSTHRTLRHPTVGYGRDQGRPAGKGEARRAAHPEDGTCRGVPFPVPANGTSGEVTTITTRFFGFVPRRCSEMGCRPAANGRQLTRRGVSAEDMVQETEHGARQEEQRFFPSRFLRRSCPSFWRPGRHESTWCTIGPEYTSGERQAWIYKPGQAGCARARALAYEQTSTAARKGMLQTDKYLGLKGWHGPFTNSNWSATRAMYIP